MTRYLDTRTGLVHEGEAPGRDRWPWVRCGEHVGEMYLLPNDDAASTCLCCIAGRSLYKGGTVGNGF